MPFFYSRLLQITLGYSRLLHVTTGNYRLSQVTYCYYRLLQDTTDYYRLLHVIEATTGYYPGPFYNYSPGVLLRRIPCIILPCSKERTQTRRKAAILLSSKKTTGEQAVHTDHRLKTTVAD